MRNSISVLIFLCALNSFSQRVSFEDPGLTFSFKKPKSWVLIDDGYEIKVAPYMRDTSHTYLTLTYFDYPEPLSNEMGTHFSVITIESETKEEFKDHMWSDDHLVISDKKVLWKKSMISKKDMLIERRFYDFDLNKKNWEIVTSAPMDNFKKHHKKFKVIIKSLRIEEASSN